MACKLLDKGFSEVTMGHTARLLLSFAFWLAFSPGNTQSQVKPGAETRSRYCGPEILSNSGKKFH
jgi:hypothetical protein